MINCLNAFSAQFILDLTVLLKKKLAIFKFRNALGHIFRGQI